jgi:hypothetical protein
MLLSVGIGCFLGILRYVLDDKWNVLPKSGCRFCISFWMIMIVEWCISGYFLFNGSEITSVIVSLVAGVSVATVLASFSYVYIKNANL